MEDSDLINPLDFSRIRLSVTMMAGEKIQDDPKKQKIFGSTKIKAKSKAKLVKDVSVAEFSDEGVVLEAPAGRTEEGEVVFLTFKLVDLEKKETFFKCNAKVRSIVKTDDPAVETIHVRLVDADEKAWAAFRDVFSNRQSEIEKFFAAAKG